MKKVAFFTPRLFKVLSAFICILFCLHAGSQQLKMTDFVLFSGAGGPGTVNPGGIGYSVYMGVSSRVLSGNVGSYTLVKTNGGVSIDGNINSGGTVELANSNNSISGPITAANSLNLSGTILKVGSLASLGANVDINGSIIISGGSVTGKVTHPVGTSYTGPVPTGGNILGPPTLPTLPNLPQIASFPAVGANNITTTQTITPGAYKDVIFNGNKTLTLSGPGVYTFNSINNSGAFNQFTFDFQNSTGSFVINVLNNVNLNLNLVNFVNGGNASRIFTEIHGTGTNAFNLSPGTSGGRHSQWFGTVWAPYSVIRVGSGSGYADITGALWSGTAINIQGAVTITNAQFDQCLAITADAGKDRGLNILANTKLFGSSNTAGVQFNWQTSGFGNIVSGQNAATAEVSSIGKYVLSVSYLGCLSKDTVIVAGKSNNLIGSELTSLYETHDTSSALSKSLFIISNDSVLIDIISIIGKYDELKTLVMTLPYGLTDTITNGPGSLIMTGKFPIAHLKKLDSLPDLINRCRPVYPPLGNSGIILTGGDSSMKTNKVRNGYNLSGDSVRVGVLSDSYNTIPGDPAATDVANRDLPGPGNPVNPYPVHVLKDYPFGKRSDEGRAMLQIIHDVAPKARLSFRTGFLTAGDFALGIHELADDTCKVIVDDITFITEPFFTSGVVQKSIHDVTQQGVHYVTAAGNYANKSYESIFNPVAPPSILTGRAHNFGGGDILQNDSLKGTVLTPGLYTIVLQWIDDIYSLGASPTGTQNDLDIYLVDNTGNSLFGVNTDNTGRDPIEVLPFTVTSNTTANILIVNASAPSNQTSSNLRFKYVVFRGDLKINEFPLGSSTIVGQGNSPDAMTVGAAFYKNTPAFNVSPPTVSSFSSIGGTMVNNVPAQKPDLVGPNGGNTSVSFGSIDAEGDGIPNFFGTSAAAPHVAAAEAILLQARKRFYNEDMPPATLKQLLQNTCIEMYTPGFDYTSGFGFVDPEAAIKTFARATPQVIKLQLADSTLQPGVQPMSLIVHGNFFSDNTKILMGSDTLPSTINNETTATTTIPIFTGDKSITAYTKPQSPSGLDGGLSNSVSITGPSKKNITIKANNLTKKYGESVPAFSVTILVDGDSIQHTSFTPASLGLANITFQCDATPFSNVGFYFIRPSHVFNAANPADAILLVKYNYEFIDGRLTVNKLPLFVEPMDKTITVGQAVGEIQFDYQFDHTNIPDPDSLLKIIKTYHQGYLSENALAVISGFNLPQADGSFLSAADLLNMSLMTSFQSVKNARKFDVVNGYLVPLPDNTDLFDAQYLVDVSAESLYDFKNDPQQAPFESTIPGEHDRALLGANALASNTGKIVTSGGLVQMVNGSLVQMVNTDIGPLAPIISGSLVQVVNASLVQVVNGVPVPIPNSGLVQVVNGSLVQVVNGVVVPLSNGSLVQLVNGSLVQMVNGGLVQIVNGLQTPVVNGSLVQVVNGSLVQVVNGVPTPIPNGSLVQLVNGSLVQMVNGSLVQVVNGSLVQVVNGSLVQVVNGGLVQIVNGTGGLGTNSKTAVIADQDDVNIQGGWLGGIFAINMVSGLDEGPQKIIPGVLIDDNLDVTYGLGDLTVNPEPNVCRTCCGNVITINQNVTVNFNTNPPSYSGDQDLLPYFSYTKVGPDPDKWTANFDLGSHKLLVKSGATITTSQVNGAAPGIMIKGTCDVEVENGGHIVVVSSNKNAGNLDIQMKGNVTINGEVRNEVNGTLGLPGAVNVFSKCGNMTVGPLGLVADLGIDPGAGAITLFTCGQSSSQTICDDGTTSNNAGLDGTITINGLVKNYAHAHILPLTDHRPDIKVIALGGAVNVNASTAEPLFDEFSEGGAKFDIYGGILSWVRDNANPGHVWVQANKDVTVHGHGTDPTGPVQESFGAIAAIATSSNSPGGLVDVRSINGRIIATDRAFDVSGRNALPTMFAHINLAAKGDINLSRVGTNNNFNPVVDASSLFAGGKGGTNDIRSYSGSINIGVNALISAAVNGSGAIVGKNRLVSCNGISNLGTITPADTIIADNNGVCQTVAPDILYPDCPNFDIAARNIQDLTVLDENKKLPLETVLFQAYPNPFSHTTSIRYDLAIAGKVLIKVFNMSGKEMATLVNENQNAGEHFANWNPGVLPGGIYYVLLNSGDYQGVKKLVLLR